jgi:hypothetical protein
LIQCISCHNWYNVFLVTTDTMYFLSQLIQCISCHNWYNVFLVTIDTMYFLSQLIQCISCHNWYNVFLVTTDTMYFLSQLIQCISCHNWYNVFLVIICRIKEYIILCMHSINTHYIHSVMVQYFDTLYQVEPVVWTSITTSRDSDELWCG